MDTIINPSASGQPSIKRLAGMAFIGMALCYITLFIIYGAVLSTPADATTAEKIAYLIENKGLYNFTYVLGYVLFACLLCFCVYVVGQLGSMASKTTVAMMSLFGYFWVVVLLCTGMIGISSNELLASQNASNPAAAEVVYYAGTLLTESLGGGIEFIGGVWLFLLGVIGWRHGLLSKTLSAFTLVKGAIGIATLFSAELVLRVVFGLSGIVWFIWIGVVLIKKSS
ncbi:hypothetical protein [Reinekea blandensis]|uniref:DUF4386 domain-containing protein n=1 Tax=Reinekea blandensis MED297 TaxID=314283 RepID=A4BA06_9GAMM|nr:hypothetical protein [Reinekea blandensis]EAR11457.1 hypothetical protein MED297_21257 [Reinekea sp. MED297] [Reinekea blandensis MED297]